MPVKITLKNVKNVGCVVLRHKIWRKFGRLSLIATFLMRGYCHAFFNCVSIKKGGEIPVVDYKEMYLALFNEITDLIEKLKKIQQRMEEMYTESDE